MSPTDLSMLTDRLTHYALNTVIAAAGRGGGGQSGTAPATAGTPTAQKEVQLLTLKVMRLTKPKLSIGQPVTCEVTDIPEVCYQTPILPV